jgi:hypothetical protein
MVESRRVTEIEDMLRSGNEFLIRRTIYQMGHRLVKNKGPIAIAGLYAHVTNCVLVETSMPIDDPETMAILDSIIADKDIPKEDFALLEMDVLQTGKPICIRVDDPETGEHRVCRETAGKQVHNRLACSLCEPTKVAYFKSDSPDI